MVPLLAVCRAHCNVFQTGVSPEIGHVCTVCHGSHVFRTSFPDGLNYNRTVVLCLHILIVQND